MKIFNPTQALPGNTELETGTPLCPWIWQGDLFYKAKIKVTWPKVKPWRNCCLTCVFEPVTPVNNSAAEVIDYAVTQLLYTYPSNDLIGAGPGKNMKQLLFTQRQKVPLPQQWWKRDGSRQRAEAQQLDIPWQTRLYIYAVISNTWQLPQRFTPFYSAGHEICSPLSKKTFATAECKNEFLCWEAEFSLLTSKMLACWVRGHITDLFRATIQSDPPQTPSKSYLYIYTHIFIYK